VEGGLTERELGRQAAARFGGDGSKSDNGQHGGEFGQPVDNVVGVEAVGIDGEAGPRPPDAGEQPGEDQHAVQGQVGAQGNREFRYDEDEGEVKEQLQPTGVALLACLGVAVLESGWVDQPWPGHGRPFGHGPPSRPGIAGRDRVADRSRGMLTVG
jgi:hypothetical protein